MDVASPTGSGELWTAAWRWWEHRPRVGFGVAVPSALGVPGIVTIEGSWERQSYQSQGTIGSQAPDALTEEHRRAAIGVGDWRTSQLHWRAGAGLDRWGDADYASLETSLAVHLAADHLSLGLNAAASASLAAGVRFATSDAWAAWRSTREPGRPWWSLQAGFATTSVGAPLGLWPGAGTGDGRAPLLRAHPLLTHGIVSGPAFGRQLAQGTAEYGRPMLTTPAGNLAWAAFTDIAAAWHRMGVDARGPMHTDVGAGIRLALRGKGGVIRIDAARGLRDRQMVLSTGWQAPWPGR
jgi:hypothetical protein